jgi:hypothetical protein
MSTAARPGKGEARGIKQAARMRFVLPLAIAFATCAISVPASVRAQEPKDVAISEDTGAALARMNRTLRTRQFSFEARTFRSYVGANGELLHIAHTLKTVFRRPDRLSVDVSGDDGASKMIYDGNTIVVYAVEEKRYASLAVSGGIDKALDAVEERARVDFPLADLLSDDPEASVLAGVTSGSQVGTATIGGVLCRHFFFGQAPDMEFELWLEDNERSLPRRLVVTYRSLPGRPILIAELSNWDLSADVPDSAFVFEPPADATKVELTQKSRASPSHPD